MATFGLNNGGPYWPLAAFQFLMFWCILVDSCSSSISFWHFSHFHAQPECGPNVSKCYVDWTWQGSGATPKSAGVAGEIGLMPVQHWYLQAGWELLYALLGSFRIVKRDTWWCLLCFYLLCFYFYHSFVCFCSRKRPWDMRPLGRARARSDETVGPCCFVSCMRRLLTSPRDSKKRWAVNCDRCKYGDNDKSITSMSWIREICLSLFVFDRSNLFVQQKPLRPRKFKRYNSSWQRPAQTIQIRADKNMSADFCHELLLEAMQSRVWELHRSCISWCLGRILEWNAVQPSIGNWRLSVLLLQTKGHWRSYSSCTVSRKRWEWWWVMPCPREYSQYSLYVCWVLLASLALFFTLVLNGSQINCLDSLAVEIGQKRTIQWQQDGSHEPEWIHVLGLRVQTSAIGKRNFVCMHRAVHKETTNQHNNITTSTTKSQPAQQYHQRNEIATKSPTQQHHQHSNITSTTRSPPPATLHTLPTAHSTLYTPHSAHYTLHSTLHTLHFTLHSTLYTLHFTLYTSHSTLSAPHSTLYTLYSRLHTLHFTLLTPHSTLYTLHSTLHTPPHSTLYTHHTPHSTLHTLHSTRHTLHSTLATFHSTLHTLQFTLHTLHFTLLTPHSTLYTPHSSLLTPHTTLHTPHSIRHTPPHSTLYTHHNPHSILHTLHSTRHTLHSTLHTLHSTLHTLHSTLYTTLYTPHSTLYTLTFYNLHYTFHTLHALHSPLHTIQSTSQYYFVLQSLHKALPSTTLYYKACTKHFPVLLCTTKLAQTTSQYYFVLHSLHKALPSTTVYYTSCTNYFPVPLCTTKLARSTSQYHFVLQSLHKVAPSTTVYYKACTKHFPVLLCTTRLAKSFPVLLCTTKLATTTSQYYFALQSLHKALPSTTLYYNACTKSFPVLLCTTKLAQSTSQYYCVLPSLHKHVPSTTLYYKACTKSFPVLLCTTKLAQTTSQYYCVLQSLHKALPSTTVYYKARTNTFQY